MRVDRQQLVGVELDSGGKGAELVVTSCWRTVTVRIAPARDARRVRNDTCVQASCSIRNESCSICWTNEMASPRTWQRKHTKRAGHTFCGIKSQQVLYRRSQPALAG